jgi:hypothetical protein
LGTKQKKGGRGKPPNQVYKSVRVDQNTGGIRNIFTGTNPTAGQNLGY